MNATILLQFAVAILWCAGLFAAISGYGALLLRLFGVGRPAFALAAVSGFSATILIGGVLNLLHAITVPVLFGFSIIGVFALLLLRLIDKQPAELETPAPSSGNIQVKLLLLFFALVFVVRVAATVHTAHYQQEDDYNFYLAAPKKMLQLHEYAPDPFSERRIMASVGGNYFLQTLVLTKLPLEDVQMADRALGLLLLAVVAFGLADEFDLTLLQRAALAVFVLITPQLQFNLTFVLLPSALFFGLVYLASHRSLLAEYRNLQALLLGMTTAAIASTKSTYLPHGVLFVLCIAVLVFSRRGTAAGLRMVVIGAAGCLLVLAPWMVAQHATSGTYFYPLLGKGFHYSSYGLYPPPSGFNAKIILHKVLPFNLPLLVILLLEWFWGEDDEQTRAIAALTAATLIASVLVGIATGGDSVRRYNYPAIVPSVLLLYVVFSRRVNHLPLVSRWRLIQGCSAVLAVATALYIGLNSWTHEYSRTAQNLRTSFSGYSIVSPSVRLQYAAMERAIPTDSGVIATVDDTFLLDYRTHHIDIADFPGAASLPPGWPGRSDGEALASYLLAHHIRYLAHSYSDDESEQSHLISVMNDRSVTQWIRSEDEMMLDSHRQYSELSRTRRHLYDDGSLYVLDLAIPAAQSAAN
ncbi:MULTISPECIES: hypothetical protein [Acidobacteriaceae]|uniref:hypothetical protein n=1 Tax=Acidobacteriaceae TaxID=204434 RepID=UPI00131B009D|nr:MULTISPECIES: hypothetical protein [Acidobacteriaceae]MDW5267826.1 hypothetical protein [Edaphobacter sp.]